MIDRNILLNKLSKIEHLSFKCEECNKGIKVFCKENYFEVESAYSKNTLTEVVNSFHTNYHKGFQQGFYVQTLNARTFQLRLVITMLS
jgi:hypothetical protein